MQIIAMRVGRWVIAIWCMAWAMTLAGAILIELTGSKSAGLVFDWSRLFGLIILMLLSNQVAKRLPFWQDAATVRCSSCKNKMLATAMSCPLCGRVATN